MFDDYPSPPSTPCSSRLRAIPHLHSHNQRASKASDIAHLLDPSYSPTRTNTYLNQIYVDHAGEAHDPDFRLFAPASYSPKRRGFLTCDSDIDDRDHNRAADADRDRDRDDDDDEIDNEDAASFSFSFSYPSPKRTSFDSARSASHYRPDSRASDPAYATFTYAFEEQAYVSDDEPRREANKLRRRRASLEHDRPVEHPDAPPEPHHYHYQQQQQQQQRPAERTACTPSASTIRRQWHALRLRTQVAAFRARKRVTRIVSSSFDGVER